MNVAVDNLKGKGFSKDIVVVNQLQILKSGLDRISIALRNLTSRTLKLKKGMNVAHVEASQVVPSLEESLGEKEIWGNSQSETLAKEKNERMSKILEQLDLTGIESWMKQQQSLVKKTVRRISAPVYSKFERVG